MEQLVYVGGPYDGQLGPSVLPSGRPVTCRGATSAGIVGGFQRGVYKRNGNRMVWVVLGGDWSDEVKAKLGVTSKL